MTRPTPMLHILYENSEWLPPLQRALDARGTPYKAHFIDGGHIDLASAPAPGVYFNRLSASAHTRGHAFAHRFARAYLMHLEGHGCDVINGTAALDMEVNKYQQLLALKRAGVRVPRTRLVTGAREELAAAAEGMAYPFIYKPNCGGKGLGVRMIASPEAFAAFLDEKAYEASCDGHHLFQEYIACPDGGVVRRYEFINGKFHYGIRVKSGGGFELCPADACQNAAASKPTFAPETNPDAGLISQYEAMLTAHNVRVCGIESMLGADGAPYTYDINVNTNYAPTVELQVETPALDALAGWLAERVDAFASKHAA